MRAIIQNVSSGGVSINGGVKKSIGRGLVILLGVSPEDDKNDVIKLVDKISKMRIFSDDHGKMNLSVLDIKGDVLIVSQFTLFANTKKGNRPSFNYAAKPEVAIPLYEQFIKEFKNCIGKDVVTGEFGASMLVDIQNNGPVTIIIDTKQDI